MKVSGKTVDDAMMHQEIRMPVIISKRTTILNSFLLLQLRTLLRCDVLAVLNVNEPAKLTQIKHLRMDFSSQ